jgi:uncharacterized protein with HEPN domain
MLDAIGAIQEFTDGMDFRAFVSDRKTVDAVLRNMEILGEAAKYIPEEITLAHPEVPWKDMRDMRNMLIHAYFGVNPEILWDTIQVNLPPLVEPLKKLLNP